MREFDAVIIGGGPAGSMCGSLLRKAGKNCLLVDYATFPRDKICGGMLSAKSWRLLEKLLPDFRYEYYGRHHISLRINGKFGCEFDAEQELRIVQRRRFDHQLLQHYQSLGGEFQKDSFKTVVEQPDGRLLLTLSSGEQVVCRYLVGADGSNSRVRRFLTGKSDRGLLAVEQCSPKDTYDDSGSIVVDLCSSYKDFGYFYCFPNPEYNVIGYGDYTMSIEKFRQILHDRHIPEGKFRGAYIYLSTDYPLRNHLILIGDAGGFANRLTCEGIYDAFQTAYNASRAIVEDRPFCETNGNVFAKLKWQTRLFKLFASGYGLLVLRLMCRFPGLIKWCFDAKMKRETFVKI
jgi:flavin-dependent dehydrogenase